MTINRAREVPVRENAVQRPLRAARWARVSSAKQNRHDSTGLPEQRYEQSDAIEQHGWADTGIEWVITNSGKSVHERPEFKEMIDRAGRDFDVLVVSYISRLSRIGEELLRAKRLIEEAGASIYFVQEHIHTADDHAWEPFANKAIQAESYRRDLAQTMKRTYRYRWLYRGLPAGVPPYGYNRDWSINQEQAAKVRAIFRDYVTKNRSLTSLAREHGLAEEHVKVIVRNPAYAGYAQRNGELREGTMEPIIDRETWQGALTQRVLRRFSASGRTPRRPSMIRGLLWCACGQKIRLNGLDRVRHMPPTCSVWGTAQHKPASVIEAPLKEALARVRPTNEYLQQMLDDLTAAPVALPPERDNSTIKAALARKWMAQQMTLEEFTTAVTALESAQEAQEDANGITVTLDDLRAYFDAFSEPTLDIDDEGNEIVSPMPDEHWAALATKVFDRIEYHGPNQLAYQPTREAQRNFIESTLPQYVLVGGEGLVPPVAYTIVPLSAVRS